jgi:integrase
MAKHPQPYFRAQRGTWCVQLDGKQITLGADEKEAFTLYHKLMSERASPAPRVLVSTAVVTTLDLFLDWCEKNRARRTYEWYFNYLQSFVKAIPVALTIADLKPFHVQQWVDSHAGWLTGKRGAIISMQRALNWAAKQGHIETSPIRHMEKPAQGKREQLITPETYQKILALVKDDAFRDLLELSWETGARPQELFGVQASYVDLPEARWIFPVKESKGKKTQRVVYLTDRALAITKKVLALGHDGFMLRNTDGEPWCMSSVSSRFQRIRDKIGTKYSLYAIRHSFCTFALAVGKLDAVTVAHLMGHRDTAMISRHYAHLTQLTDHMRDAANRVRPQGVSA